MTDNDRLCLANNQYSRPECLEVAGIDSSVGDTALEDKVCQICCEIGVKVGENDIQSTYQLKKGKY